MTPPARPLQIVLASASPRRRDLLRAVNLEFSVRVSDVDENVDGLGPEELVLELACRKAEAVASMLSQEAGPGERLIIAADTVIELDGRILGKPVGPDAAREMLSALSARMHRVVTGVHLIHEHGEGRLAAAGFETTSVYFAALSIDQINDYIAGGEPMDKAGAYGIQGPAAFFVERIEGCYFNVVGLPLRRLYVMAASLGVNLGRSE